MEKIKLEIAGLSYSQTQSGAYALVLSETIGKRRLPIIIGGFEAQAIAIELEKMTPSRPLTHDLFKNFAELFKINITEIIIYNLVEGIFFAKLICEHEGKEIEIDSRTSDAIALAIRFDCPIYTYEFVLSSAGIILDDDDIEETSEEITPELNVEEISQSPIERMSVKELKSQLKDAIDNEDYENASRLRDEINKRKKD
ncbi:MAG: bifunctional nuclease family protein [Bacteroidota bacterium]|nr:bifunctional nuclease family protein [Bacteroidota bacterium]|tara:strand:+ start:1397 stop:1993 length:597 start_codon:yes stop_codon:yes gene_type:complete